jgi:serine/threonine-protein kinase
MARNRHDSVRAPAPISDDDESAISGAILGKPCSAKLRTTVLPHRDSGARFRHIASLGEGRMGEVTLVEDRDFCRRVVLKTLPRAPKDADLLVRFANEARLLGRLEHPGILPLHDVGVDENGQHYLVVKYLEGETLANVIRKLRQGERAYLERFGWSERLGIFASIVETVTYVHAQGVIHRDLRPDNVVIGPHGEVTIVDFGIAKPVGRGDLTSKAREELTSAAQDRLIQTQLGALLGTPRYMSPEQAAGRNEDLDERSDLFSLGLILAELMTLEHPLSHQHHNNEILAELVARGVDPSRIAERWRRAALPTELLRLLSCALEHDRAKRYGSAQEMLRDLRRVQRGEVAVTCHVTLFKRSAYESQRWIERHPLAYLVVCATAALAFLASTGFGLWRLFAAG